MSADPDQVSALMCVQNGELTPIGANLYPEKYLTR